MDRNAGVMLLSEPYLSCGGNSALILDDSGKAAIKCWCPFYVQKWATSPMRCIAYARAKGVHIYSCYAPPSDSPDQFEGMLDMLVRHARGRRPTVIAGDFNAGQPNGVAESPTPEDVQ